MVPGGGVRVLIHTLLDGGNGGKMAVWRVMVAGYMKRSMVTILELREDFSRR